MAFQQLFCGFRLKFGFLFCLFLDLLKQLSIWQKIIIFENEHISSPYMYKWQAKESVDCPSLKEP